SRETIDDRPSETDPAGCPHGRWMGHNSAGAQKTGGDPLVPEFSRVRSGEGHAEPAPADSHRAGNARHASAAVELRPPRSARPLPQESPARRSSEGARREPPARPRDERRVRRVPHAGRTPGQCRGRVRDHHVAAENLPDAGIRREVGKVVTDPLARALDIARAYIASRTERPVWPTVSVEDLRAALGTALPEHPIDPADVVSALAHAAEPGIVTTTGPRYFGFVTGGALPATVAAEWLTTVWDQPAGLFVPSPAASVLG